jgi:hypothetical protein
VTRRPVYVLWIGPDRLPVNCSTDHYWQPVRLDRQQPKRRTA